MNFLSKMAQSKAIIFLFFNVIIAGIGFLNFSLLAHHYSPDFFGKWIAFIAGASFFEMIRSGLIQAAVIKFSIGQNQKTQNRYSHISFWAGFLLTCFISALIFFTENLILFNSNLDTKAISLFFDSFPLFFLISFPRSFILWLWQGKRKYLAYFIFQLITFGIFSIFLLKEVLLGNSGLTPIQVYILTHALCSIIALFYLRNSLLRFDYFSLLKLKELFSFGGYSMSTQLIINLLKTSDVLMIGYFSGPTSLALYAIPLKLTEVYDLITRSLTTNNYPHLIEIFNSKNKLTFNQILSKYIIISILLFALLSATIGSFASPFTLLLGGSKYLDALYIIYIFLITRLADPYIRFSGVAFEAIGRPSLNFIRYSLMLLVNVVLNYFVLFSGLALEWVASVNIIVAITGLYFGFYYLKKCGIIIYFSEYKKYCKSVYQDLLPVFI